LGGTDGIPYRDIRYMSFWYHHIWVGRALVIRAQTHLRKAGAQTDN